MLKKCLEQILTLKHRVRKEDKIGNLNLHIKKMK